MKPDSNSNAQHSCSPWNNSQEPEKETREVDVRGRIETVETAESGKNIKKSTGEFRRLAVT